MTQRSASLTRSNGTPGRPNAYTTALSRPTLNPFGNRVARFGDRPPHRNPREQHEAQDEEAHQGDDRVPVAARQLVGEAEQQRSEPTRPAVAHLVRREVLG